MKEQRLTFSLPRIELTHVTWRNIAGAMTYGLTLKGQVINYLQGEGGGAIVLAIEHEGERQVKFYLYKKGVGWK